MLEVATALVPTYYLLAAAAVSAFAVWRIQAFRIARQCRDFAAISRENSRTAQEVHDQLLQGVLGVAWQVEAASKQLPAHPQEAKDQINKLLIRIDSVLVEARQSISHLQENSYKPIQLAEILKQKSNLNFQSPAIQYPVEAFGSPRGLFPDVAHSLRFIILEAWVNARQHAEPTEVRTELHYEPNRFLVTISDNGKGMIVGEEMAEPGKGGIWRMHQRALKIKGTLSIASRPGAGTRIEISLDAIDAYASIPARSKLKALFRFALRSSWNQEQW
jgi:signal transduction histidine kinase